MKLKRKDISKPKRRLALEQLESRRVMALTGFGVAGDSISDEYANGAFSYAKSWVELLAQNSGVGFGTQGNYAEPRRTGYANNWSRDGADSNTISTQGQITGLSQQISSLAVTHSVLEIGQKDFAPDSAAYAAIYNGTWTPAQITQYVSTVVGNIQSAVSILTFPGGEIVLANIPDYGASPAAVTAFPNAAKRALVSAAIQSANQQLVGVAANLHIPLVDLNGLFTAVLGPATAPIASQKIGGVTFTNTARADQNSFFTSDGAHLNTPMQALVANLFLSGFKFGFGETVTTFNESQIDGVTGNTFQGVNTLNLQYSPLVTVPKLNILLDYGTGVAANDFTTRMNELADRLGVTHFSTTEINTLKSQVMNGLTNAFSSFLVQFTTTQPSSGSFETVSFGKNQSSVANSTPNSPAFASLDWLNQNNSDTAYVFPSNFYSNSMSLLSRSELTTLLANALTYFAAHDLGKTFGLDRSDAFGDPRLTSANYASTSGLQQHDFMYEDDKAVFDSIYFQNNTRFSFSQLSLAKMNFDSSLSLVPISSVSETIGAHNAVGTAQAMTLNDLTARGVNGVSAANVHQAVISLANEHDLYSITVKKGDLITANAISAAIYSPGTLDTLIQLRDSSGTLLTTSDDTYLGPNGFGQGNGTTATSTDAIIVNYVAPADGVYVIDVSAKSGGTGSYDLFMTKTISNINPWLNQRSTLDVNDDGFIVPLDALLIINELNVPKYSDGTGKLQATNPTGLITPQYLDTNNDGYVAPIDVLLVINYLNNPPGSGEGSTAVASLDASVAQAANDSLADPLAASALAAPTSTNTTQQSSSQTAATDTSIASSPATTTSFLVVQQTTLSSWNSSSSVIGNSSSNSLEDVLNILAPDVLSTKL